MNDIILEVENLSLKYDEKIILDNISFQLPKGVRCAVVGPNGAGKTSLIESILNLNSFYCGNIKILKKQLKEIYLSVSYIPQKKNVDWNFPITVQEVVDMAHKKFFIWQFLTKEEKIKSKNSIDLVNLTEYKDKKINELSGGQQQRVFIARALAQEAQLYILDEPFVGVDKVTEKVISSIFFKLQQENKTVFVVHHDWNTINEYFDWIMFLNKTIIYCGPIKDINLKDYINQTFL